ncbi:MAG: hypothetical protein CMG55_05535 [Candidatus Marinimicrobia bacterium]|nr:hypothetical protein [Candidatus Neomarinimicrobiota bacterium]
MKIKNYITIFRFHTLKYKFLGNLISIGILGAILFAILIFLENIFYFSSNTKLYVYYSFVIITLGFICYWITFLYLTKNEKIHIYKTDKLAIDLGKKLFPNKEDTILNALQLERNAKNNESKILALSYINSIIKKLKNFDISLLTKHKERSKYKIALLATWSSIIIILFFNYEQSAGAYYRWINPKKEFLAPKPFNLSSTTGAIHILGGEKAEINIKVSTQIPDTLNLYLTPTQISTQERDSLKLQFTLPPTANFEYNFKLPELFQDYSYQAIVSARYFWEPWEQVTTQPETIFVTDRPSFETFYTTISPPKYSKLPKIQQEGNIAVVKALKGSEILIDITSNKILQSSYLNLNNVKINMVNSHNAASGGFTLLNKGDFTVNLVDKRGITNRDPISYLIEIIPDHDPILNVIQPTQTIDLDNEQTIPIHLEIIDDYGFTDLQLAYEIRKPAYLEDDPFVSMFILDELTPDSLIQSIQRLWSVEDLSLMPGDEVHFHFELSDNDNISGPKKTLSNTFIARVPSLTNLYDNIANSEEEFYDNIVENLEGMEKIKEEFKTLELKLLKSKELDWDQKQSIQNSMQNAKEKLSSLEKISEAIESITDQADKHKLFSPNLLEKFEELSKLMNNIIPENMQNDMDKLQSALENLDMKSLQDALNNLAENIDQIEKDLDRYLEIFKKFQAEQKLDEIQKRLQQLFEQQNALDNDIRKLDKDSDPSTIQRFTKEQKRNSDEFENILSLMEEASSLVKPFSDSTSQALSDLADSQLSNKTKSDLQKTSKNLKAQNLQSAQNSSNNSLEDIDNIMQQMINIQQQFQKETVSIMTEKFQKLMQDMLYLSSQEERLRSAVDQSYRNSPRLKELATHQQMLQDQLQAITNQMMELSKETFAITPEIGKGIGKANAGMKDAKTNLTERNTSQAGKSQDYSIQGLNEAAMGLFQSIQKMQKSGSASGFEQFMQMMQQMAGQQEALNQQGMQLALGQMAAATQQQIMQQMMKGQKGLKKSLEQLINEMRQSGEKGLGDLNGISKEMDEVIKDLINKQFNRKTQERQQRILSRMLDSQISMTQRGEKEERKSFTVKSQILYEGPGGLPADLGQRENLALKALNESMKAGYSKEHQTMIKRYFNSLSKKPIDKENENNIIK